ncbi:TolC family protein [Catalinimonas locisalis]|uniref:TolC family protein n=1 Tax=Catalinimonas locisalis TaxID=3133978 RepID=UPI003100E1AE
MKKLKRIHIKTLIRAISLLLLLGMTLPLSAQEGEEVSLPELVNRVFSANYQVQIYRNEEQIAYNNNTLGNAGFFPTVDLIADRTIGYNTTTIQFFEGEERNRDNARNTSFNAMVEVNWIVFDGFRMFAEKNRLEYLQQIGALETRYFLEQTISDVAKTYYELIRQRQLLANFRESQEISAYRMRLEQKRREVGAAGALQYYQSRVDFNTDSAQIVEQINNIENLSVQINDQINFPLEQVLRPADEEISFRTLPSPDSLLEMAQAQNRELRLARLEELLSEILVDLEQSQRYPEVSLFGNYSYVRSTSEIGITESQRSYGPEFGIRLRLNLYDGGRTNIAINNAELRQNNQRINRTEREQAIRAAMIQNINLYEALQRQLSITEESLESARLSLQIAEEQLELGAINGYDFRLTQQAFINVRNDLINFRYQLKSTEIDIRRLSGQLLTR